MTSPTSKLANPIVETYSRLAEHYDDDPNLHSCWGQGADKALGSIHLKDDYRLILDIGCGTGRALAWLASRARSRVQFVGIDPAENMRNLALRRVQPFRNVQIWDGSFEHIPLETGSVDYLFSIFAFHWTTDPDAAVREVRRVLKPGGCLLLIEHVQAQGAFARRVQDIITPVTKRMAGNCHWNRDTARSVINADFQIEDKRDISGRIPPMIVLRARRG